MMRFSGVLALGLLCFAAPATGSVASFSTSGITQLAQAVDDTIYRLTNFVDSAEEPMSLAAGHVVRHSECLEVPVELQVFGIDDICAELDLIGCDNHVKARISMKGASQPLFEVNIDPKQQQICAETKNFTGNSPIPLVCGEDVKICLTFLRDGMNTLQVEQSFLSGCPTLIIEHCAPPIPNTLPLSNLPLEMPCFNVGTMCDQHKSCYECTESMNSKGHEVCGWCETSKTCVSGNEHGPRCGACGGDTCGCQYSYGSCPAKPADMAEIDKEIKSNYDEVQTLIKTWEGIKDSIKTGGEIPHDDKKYVCETPGEKKSSSAVGVTVTVFVTLGVLLLTLIFGAFAGKQGWADMAWERLSQIRLPRRDDETALRPPSPSTYTPPSM